LALGNSTTQGPNAAPTRLFRVPGVFNKDGNIGQCVGWKHSLRMFKVIETGRNDHFVLDSDQRNLLPSLVGSHSGGLV